MSPVEQQRCIPSGCIVGQGDRASVHHFEGNLGETVSLLQFFAHFYSLISPLTGVGMRAQFEMPDAQKGCAADWF